MGRGWKEGEGAEGEIKIEEAKLEKNNELKLIQLASLSLFPFRPEHVSLLDRYVARVYELGMGKPLPKLEEIKAVLPKLKRHTLVS